MKRSEVNTIMQEANDFIRSCGLYLPPFAYWSPSDWRKKGEEAREIVENSLGWDITDFGLGRYRQDGLFLFTVRNGSQAEMRAKAGRLYCEKLMVVGEKQYTPLHHHWIKIEDIINRGGGNLMLRLFNATKDRGLEDTPVTATLDGVKRQFKAGEVVTLRPGESITLLPYVFHEFWGEGGTVMVGEVSLVNDDNNDNCFHKPVGRFPTIEEDVEPLHLLTKDYANYWMKN
jgi:D-lyxose ketol-isomerase